MQSNSGNKINARRDTVSIKRPYVLNDMCPSQLFWEMAIHRISFVAHRQRHEFWLWKSWWKSWTVPAGSQILMCPSQLQMIFKSSSHITIFIFLFYLFLADPGDGYIPRRRALDAEPCKYHENNLCTLLNGMYPSHGFMRFFQIFFVQKRIVESVRRIELVRKAEPTRWDRTSDFPFVARRISGEFFI